MLVAVGNQQEWFQSGFYIILLTFSLIHIVLFFIRFAGSPPLLNPVFSDINFVISCPISTILFAVFLIFAIVPHFMELVIGNLVGTYATPFVFFAIASTATIYPFAQALISTTSPAASKLAESFPASALLALASLLCGWLTQPQPKQELDPALISLGCCFGLINELLMALPRSC